MINEVRAISQIISRRLGNDKPAINALINIGFIQQ